MNKLFYLASFLLSSLFVQAQITFEPVPTFFAQKRQLPLVNLNVKQTINVSAYGAVVNDGIDDTKAIKDAFAWANLYSNLNNPVKIVFETGKYDVFPADNLNHNFSFSGIDCIVVEGNNAEIINHNPQVGLMIFDGCGKVIIKDLIIDYDKLPFTQGLVTAVNSTNRTFDLTISDGFPQLDEPYFTSAPQKWGMLKEASGKLKNNADYLFPYYGWTKVSDRVFRISQPNLTGQVKTGDYFVQIARNNGSSVFHVQNSNQITFLNVTVHASPTVAWGANDNMEWNIINCNVVPKPGRLHSTNADCIHANGSYLGAWVQGCRFEAVSDDVVNYKFGLRSIESVLASNKIRISGGTVEVDDTLQFYNPRDGIYLGEAVVTSTRTASGVSGQQDVTLSGNISVTQTGSHQTADKAYIKNRSNESFVFRNNTLKNIRRYGMFLQNGGGIIENNTFENLSGGGIRIENGVDWKEGFTANNIVIRNNQFANCGFDNQFKNDGSAATISVQFSKLGMPCNTTQSWCGVVATSWQGHRHIQITENNIVYNKKGLHITNVNGLFVSNNTLTRNANDPTGTANTPSYINNCTMRSGSITAIDNPVAEKLLLYPTLVDSEIFFSQQINDVQVFDINGKLILKMNHPVSKLSVSDLRSGIYLLRSGLVSQRFIKK